MVLNEKEICRYLDIPSIPKKKWDGKTSFQHGVAIANLVSGAQSYVAVSFDNEKDLSPRIRKVFELEQYTTIGDVFVVPSYMNVDVDNMDLDDDSKDMAKLLVEEADEKISDNEIFDDTPSNEYFFDNIKNDEEAIAFIRSYYKSKGAGKKRKIPKKHESIIIALSVIYNEIQNKENGK